MKLKWFIVKQTKETVLMELERMMEKMTEKCLNLMMKLIKPNLGQLSIQTSIMLK
jgi:hypothetical protein